MDDFTLTRVVHVVAVLFWIGGVGLVTLVLMPALRAAEKPDDRLAAFHRIEGRFAPQAKIWVVLAGASGFWMTYRADLWSRFADLHYWWMHAMLDVWLIFFVMLFVLEPLFLHRRMLNSQTPAADFQRMEWAHRLLLAVSVIAVIGAVGGSHGLF
ncbi:hypothetical protein [Aquisediminimonas sediminicola]|uniref:hypothetical protein n=1 Tax=Alteraquisediminimonas sediminicola TaxID=2676787 RepID=UPI001C8E3FDC|nr:hypothetical protein [Aquisediminimonas sediminicola]